MAGPYASRAKVFRFLTDHPLGVLSTVTADGLPHGAAIYFGIDTALSFYFITRTGTQKYKNMQASPFGALTVTDESEQVTVQINGALQPVTDAVMIDKIMWTFSELNSPARSNWVPPVAKMRHGNYAVMQLKPSQVRFADFKSMQPDSRDYFRDVLLP